MKKLITLIALLTASSLTFAQEPETPAPDKTLVIKNTRVSIIETDSTSADSTSKSKSISISASLEVGPNGYLTPDNSISLNESQELMELDYQRSRYFAYHILVDNLNLYKDHVSLITGLGLSYNGYFFENNVSIGTDNDTTLFMRDSVISYQKYKLRATYLQIPLMLSFKLYEGEKHNVNFAAGIIGGLRIGSRVKAKYKLDGDRKKDKIIDDFNLSPFKADLTARIGIGAIGLAFNYGLISMFEKGKAPELYPFSIGLTLGGF